MNDQSKAGDPAQMALEQAVRGRPGMYVGETNWQAALHCLGIAIETVGWLLYDHTRPSKDAIYAQARPFFDLRSYLRIDLRHDDSTFAITADYEPQNNAEIANRLAKLTAFKVQMGNPDNMEFAVLIALSDEFCLSHETVNGRKVIQQKGPAPESTFVHDPAKPRDRIAMSFTLADCIDLSKLTRDRLRGFMFAQKRTLPATLFYGGALEDDPNLTSVWF